VCVIFHCSWARLAVVLIAANLSSLRCEVVCSRPHCFLPLIGKHNGFLNWLTTVSCVSYYRQLQFSGVSATYPQCVESMKKAQVRAYAKYILVARFILPHWVGSAASIARAVLTNTVCLAMQVSLSITCRAQIQNSATTADYTDYTTCSEVGIL
jgi:hypothetical protein